MSSDRVFYREVKPYHAPSELAELHGPAYGRVDLPLNVYWGPAHVFDLNNESDLVEAYQAVIREGRVQDQAVILNPELLVSIWPELMLPVRVRMLWEGRFRELAAANIRSRWTLLSPAHSAELIRTELAAGRAHVAIRVATEMAGRLRASENCEFSVFQSEPASTGDIRWDTFLATIVLWNLRTRGSEAPSWTDYPPLDSEWFVGYERSIERGWRELVRSETPRDFLLRRILVREKSLIVL